MFFETWHIAIIAVILVCIVVAFVVMFRERRKLREEVERAAGQHKVERSEQKLRDQRFNLGGRIYNALTEAARANPTGRIVVEKLPRNGGMYSVLVRLDELGVASYEQAQFQVNLKYRGDVGEEFLIIEGKYGPTYKYHATEDCVLSQLPWLVEKTKSWGVAGKFPKRDEMVA